jgi:1,4-dihydroxy-2-naphthoate octaprenyltransferase
MFGGDAVPRPSTRPAAPAATPSRPGLRPLTWLPAFVGFYRPDGESLRDLDPVARFLYAARSVILVISAQAAAIAGLLAITARKFNLLDFVMLLLGLVVAHAISNLSNDYFGYKRGHDTVESPRMNYTLHPVASGALTPRQLATGIGVLGALGLAVCVYFALTVGVGAIAFAVVGAILLYGYDASPITLKGIGLGEIASFVVWGPLMVGGGYYVITGSLPATVLLASVPYGLGVMSILLGKHIDQRPFDIGAGQHTLPVLMGERPARRLDQIIVAAMYVVVVVGILLGWLTPFTLLVFLAAPRALRAIQAMTVPHPDTKPEGYVGWPLWFHRSCLVHNRLFGWVYLAGLALGAIVPDFHL